MIKYKERVRLAGNYFGVLEGAMIKLQKELVGQSDKGQTYGIYSPIMEQARDLVDLEDAFHCLTKLLTNDAELMCLDSKFFQLDDDEVVVLLASSGVLDIYHRGHGSKYVGDLVDFINTMLNLDDTPVAKVIK